MTLKALMVRKRDPLRSSALLVRNRGVTYLKGGRTYLQNNGASLVFVYAVLLMLSSDGCTRCTCLLMQISSFGQRIAGPRTCTWVQVGRTLSRKRSIRTISSNLRIRRRYVRGLLLQRNNADSVPRRTIARLSTKPYYMPISREMAILHRA